MKLITLALVSALMSISLAAAQTVTINKTDVNGPGPSLGTLLLADSPYGLLITPSLSGLAPGINGFHVHEKPNCGPVIRDGRTIPGGAAGGHYDPESTGKHLGPYGDGHLGDLPPLLILADGTSTTPVLAPRLTLNDVQNRSIMIHAGGDNFSDHPAKLGGGGARMACGVIQ